MTYLPLFVSASWRPLQSGCMYSFHPTEVSCTEGKGRPPPHNPLPSVQSVPMSAWLAWSQRRGDSLKESKTRRHSITWHRYRTSSSKWLTKPSLGNICRWCYKLYIADAFTISDDFVVLEHTNRFSLTTFVLQILSYKYHPKRLSIWPFA
mgnify:CR=1 FL=1